MIYKRKYFLLLLILGGFLSILADSALICKAFKIETEFEVDFGATDVDYYNGLFYISNNVLNQVQVYSCEGSKEKVIGRKGQGPAEFSIYSPDLILISDEKLIVNDGGGLRIQLLDLNGRFLKQYKMISDIPLNKIHRFYSLKNNKIGYYGYSFTAIKGQEVSIVCRFIFFDYVSGSAEEIYSKPFGDFKINGLKSLNPFSSFPFPSVSKELIFQADNKIYKIDIFNAKKNKEREIKSDVKLLAIPDDAKNYFLTKDKLDRIKAISSVPIGVSLPSHFPAIREVFVVEEKIFVWTWKSWYEKNLNKNDSSYSVDVWDLKGNYLGECAVSFNPEEIVKIRGKRIFIIHSGDEKTILRVYRLND